jgi:hypothetical protein
LQRTALRSERPWIGAECAEAGWSGFAIGERIPLSEIVRAHEVAERPRHPGRVVVTL